MLKRILYIILIASIYALGLAGCGSETSGSISMAQPTYSNGVVTAQAKYVPASGTALPNQNITFYWRTVGQTTGAVVNYQKESDTDSTGTASSDLTLPTPRTEALIVYVKAGTGDLTTSQQSVNVP